MFETFRKKGHPITAVDAASPAEKAGIRAGERLLCIDDDPIVDVIDYEYLTVARSLSLTLLDETGKKVFTKHIRKYMYESLGLNFATSLMDKVRVCKNHCVFCFVDQMPKGVRTSLSFKDDDWRLSFVMGNYVTLTNLSEPEFERLLRRKASPLFISVHATDPALRVKLMGNPTAGSIMERLRRLNENGIRFHMQIVLCPGLNDGEALMNTLNDLAALTPGAQSVAIVPVGVTRFREGLFPLKTFDRASANQVIDAVERFQSGMMERLDTRFAFLSDEWYLLAGRTLPPCADYEDFPQIENGVGLIRLFESDLDLYLDEMKPLDKPVHVSFAGGVSATPVMTEIIRRLEDYNVYFETFAVRNDFFGGNVSVAGLVTGQDIVKQLRGRISGERLFIPRCMLRETESVFLDDMRLEEAEEALGIRIIPVRNAEELVTLLLDGDRL